MTMDTNIDTRITGPFQEFPDVSEWDAIIIGGGPNGMIAAAYLAKAGMKVVLVERRWEVGGGLSTEEILYPCYYSNVHIIYHMMVDYMPALKDFNLDKHAISWVRPNAQTAMVFEDGGSILMSRMTADTKDSMSKYSWKDANTFAKLMRKWKRVVDEIVAPATYVPAASPMDLSIALEKTEVGREMLEMTEMTPYEIITQNFENDKIRALLLYISCMWGIDPNESGLGFYVALQLYRGVNKCYSYGGSHKLAGAFERVIVENGGLVLEAAEATKIIMENGKAAGIELAEGRTLKSPVIISSLDPHTTFLDLVGEEHLPGTLGESVKEWIYDKWSFHTLHLASMEKPIYKKVDANGKPVKGYDNWVNDAFMVIFGVESTDQLLEHWKNVVGGRIDDNNFCGHATCETTIDPHMTRWPGRQISFFQMHAPYEIEGGWAKREPEINQAILDKWERVAPGFTKNDNILKMSGETPEDIAIRFPNMRKGSIKHGDYRPTQMNTFRPNLDCSGHKTPVEGLYICGASSFPGGTLLGGPGYLAANRVAEDLGVTKWWKPTVEVEKFLKTYFEG
ncbi:MAG: NAD(P)/FAD-dependent oxidoreductase [Chloroflexota bacterium]|nr:NAD(P)/FAD-dependent oxidoreductase [Chloroflexota bacterium]